MTETTTLPITIPDGFEVDLEKTTSSSIVLKKKEKEILTWEEIQEENMKREKVQYYLSPAGNTSAIKLNTTVPTRILNNNVPSEREIERLTARCKLTIIADYYNEGWVPSKTSEMRYYICYSVGDDKYVISAFFAHIAGDVYFKTRELAEKALEHNKEIFEAYLKP